MIISFTYMSWFLFYLYLTMYFYQMGRVYNSIINDIDTFFITQKIILWTVGIIFTLGSAHFFLFYALYSMIMVFDKDFDPPEWMNIILKVCEYFESFTPLVFGVFIIYIIHRVGFIDEDDD